METFFQSGMQIFITCLVVFVAQVVYSLFGFGAGMFSVSILAFFFDDISNLVILVLLMSVPVELFIVLKTKNFIKPGKIFLLVLSLFIGILIGNELLVMRESLDLIKMMGVVLTVFSIYFIFFEQRVKPKKVNSFWTFVLGFFSGLTAATFSMGGPPIILYYRFLNPPKSEFRVNLLLIFFITSCIRIPFYIGNGLLSMIQVNSAVIVAPFIIAGVCLGYYLHLNIDELRFKKYTAFAILILGIMLFFKH